MKRAMLCGVMAVLFLAAPAWAADPCSDPLTTAAGQLSGLSEKGSNTCVFRGIPYAAPPVGSLRWRAPEPAPAWTGVRPATTWGARCMQEGFMDLINFDPSDKMSEDCLYLNIWRPKKSGSFPVMVWIHGGGYTEGTGNTPMYWGDRLAEAGDVVVVTFNYRLSVFGFLATAALRAEDKNGSVGSYGSLDQAAAIKWVHDNIAAFGGDPGNVTIFGESAGGWSVCTMLATPLTRGLIHRAILESGGCLISASVEKGYEQGRQTVEKLGCKPDDLPCLRALPAEKILKAATGGLTDGFVWMPHQDGYVLTDTPLKMIRSGNYNQIPFMAGSNKNEVDALLNLLPDLARAKPDQFEALLKKYLGVNDQEAAQLAALYPPSHYEDTGAAFGAAATDGMLACPTYLGLLAASAGPAKTFYYRFDYHGMYMGEALGAVHAMEVPFVFNTLDRKPISMLYPGKVKPPTAELAKTVQRYWLNFAHSGDPNGADLPAWPSFSAADPRTQVLDMPVRTESSGNIEQCRFWDEYNQSHPPLTESMGNLGGK